MARNSIDIEVFAVREVFVDINREALLHTAKREQAEVVILRVQTFGPNGRPTSRTLRLPASLLEEPPPRGDAQL